MRNKYFLYIKDSSIQCGILKSPVNNNGDLIFDINAGKIKITNKDNVLIIQNV